MLVQIGLPLTMAAMIMIIITMNNTNIVVNIAISDAGTETRLSRRAGRGPRSPVITTCIMRDGTCYSINVSHIAPFCKSTGDNGLPKPFACLWLQMVSRHSHANYTSTRHMLELVTITCSYYQQY